MSDFVILPDVTCDLSAQMREFFGLEDYIHGYTHINDKSVKTTLDWENIPRDEFYKILGSKKNTVSSASASPEEFYMAFKRYTDEGKAVISMSISSKISGTYNIATTAKDRVLAECPDAKIYCLDSERMSGSFGLLVAYACLLRSEGKSFDEVVAWLEENKSRVHQMGPIDDLSFIARRGKISKGKAFMGNLVGVKPMGDSNRDGYVTVLAKVKGIKKALEVSTAYLKRVAENPEEQYIFVMHSDREAAANELAERIRAELNPKCVFVGDVFSACGTNIGPGMISAYFLGAPISEDNEAEKAALADAIAAVEAK